MSEELVDPFAKYALAEAAYREGYDDGWATGTAAMSEDRAYSADTDWPKSFAYARTPAPQAEGLREALETERARSDKLIAWLYDACDGFPVSQEAFDAFSADDMKAIGAAIANRTDEQYSTLDEFRAKVLALSPQAQPTETR